MKTNRIKNTIYNSASNLIINITVTLLSFALRTIFIKKLGEQCLGLDGLFTNILSLLSVTELGFSTAVSFCLYSPLAKKDNEKVSKIMAYFKKTYRKIAQFILIIGLLLIPFLHLMTKDYTISENIYIIYLLYLINTVSSYLISYSTILIEADQKNYKLTKYRLCYNFLTYGLQFIALIFFNSFMLYLIIQLIIRMLERVVVNNYIKRNYQDVNFDSVEDISMQDKKTIMTNIKGLLFHKIGDFAINGTDNILISSIVSISQTGIYSNYLSFTSVFKNIISSVINASISSFGNLNVTETEETKRNVFELLNFICYALTGLVAVGLYFCINKFITIWIGKAYIVSQINIIIICINFYLTCILLPINAIKNSTGLFYADRFVPIVQAIVNLLVSIILGIYFGLTGILIGTTISYILIAIPLKPYYVYKYVFKSKCYKYFGQVFKNIIITMCTILIGILILKNIVVENIILDLICSGIIVSLIYVVLFVIINYNNKSFKYYKELIFKIIKKNN